MRNYSSLKCQIVRLLFLPIFVLSPADLANSAVLFWALVPIQTPDAIVSPYNHSLSFFRGIWMDNMDDNGAKSLNQTAELFNRIFANFMRKIVSENS